MCLYNSFNVQCLTNKFKFIKTREFLVASISKLASEILKAEQQVESYKIAKQKTT